MTNTKQLIAYALIFNLAVGCTFALPHHAGLAAAPTLTHGAWNPFNSQERQIVLNAKLLGSDQSATASFGYDVDISGDTAVVGAWHDDINWKKGQGSVFVYVKKDGFWVEQAKLTAADGKAKDQFGHRVAIDGDTIVVGVPLASDGNAPPDRYKGAAYVFTRKGDNWERQIKLKPSDATGADAFGADVDISGDTIVIGAPGNDNLPFDKVPQAHGAGFVYKRSGGDWVEQKKLVNEKRTAVGLGSTVAIHDKTIVLGTANDTGPAGAAYVYVNEGVGWKMDGKLRSGVDRTNEHFSFQGLAIDGNTIVVGASGAGSRLPGAVYVFERGAKEWIMKTKLAAPNNKAEDQFGIATAISGDTIVVGMSQIGSPLPIRAYVYKRKLTPNGHVWSDRQILISPETFIGDSFAGAIGISGDNIIIGASNHDSNLKRKTRGAAYIFSDKAPAP